MKPVRSLAALLAVASAIAAGAAARAEWPLWDGKESVADYAKRAGIKDVETSLDLGGGASMKLTLIPAGRFFMGGPDEKSVIIEGVNVVIQEGWGAHWILPGREVTISQPFYMGTHEVTQEQYDQVMGPDPGREARYDKDKPNARDHLFRYGHGNDVPTRGKTYPEGTLSWKEAAEFCEKASTKTGMHVWLPTEAQWEYACKAGSTKRFPWGDDPADAHKYINVTLIKEGETLETAKVTSGFRGIAVVGSLKPNAWGLYDMLGNVNEWCHDWYTQNYLGAPALDPVGPGITAPNGGWCHVGRGGNYKSTYGPPDATASRWSHHMNQRCGFRVVVPLKSTTPTPKGAVVSWVLGRGEQFLKAPAPAKPPAATAGAVDSSLRVPPGCRAAAGTQAEPYTKTGYAQAILHEASGMEMVYIPAGTFRMGTPADYKPWQGESEKGYMARFERPRRVTLTRGFYMAKHEVTQAQWERVMGYNPSLFKNVGPEAPVETVSWNECQEFCTKAGGGLRLPTEAEWEYACRAGSTGPYAGDLDDIGWHDGNSAGTTHPVGSKKPNAWGLYDMHGNVREWCHDAHAPEYPPNDAVTDPTGPSIPAKGGEEGRVVRGGSWADYPFFCRSAARDAMPANMHKVQRNVWEDAKTEGSYMHRPIFGFRLVITAPGAP
jgi:formylglycine-generating enzyme required for sulfatase activity